MKVLKILVTIVVAIVFVGGAVVLGRNSSDSGYVTTTIPPGLDESAYSLHFQTSQTGTNMSSSIARPSLLNAKPLSRGVPIEDNSPSRCRTTLMTGLISRYNLYENEVAVDRYDTLRGRTKVRIDGSMEAPSLAKKLNIPYQEVVADLWESGFSNTDSWATHPQLKYMYGGKDVSMQTASGTVFRFLGIKNEDCSVHFEQFEWNPSLVSKLSPDDFVEFGDHLRQFPN